MDHPDWDHTRGSKLTTALKIQKGEIRIFHIISSLVLDCIVNTDKKASVESSTQPSRPRNRKLGHRPLKNAFFDLKPGRIKKNFQIQQITVDNPSISLINSTDVFDSILL